MNSIAGRMYFFRKKVWNVLPNPEKISLAVVAVDIRSVSGFGSDQVW